MEELVMSGTVMIVLIVLISVGFGVFSDLYKKHLELKKLNAVDEEKHKEMTKELALLKERVNTLEKIVTDSSYDLSEKIKKL